MTVVEVIPLVAGAAPVIVGSGVVGAVVGVLRLLVQGTGLGVLDESLGVQVGRLLAVEDGAHLQPDQDVRIECENGIIGVTARANSEFRSNPTQIDIK